MTASLIPVLAVRDVGAATALLTAIFGFKPIHGGRLQLGDQVIEFEADPDGASGHGPIDHLALAVDDVPAALASAEALGGHLDRAVTPEGPRFIPEFWSGGAAFVFLEGPEGAKIEFCARPGDPRPGLPGHDHIGIACAGFPALRDFFLDHGFAEIATHLLQDPAGDTPVSFLALGDSVVELYSPPELRAAPHDPGSTPYWRRLVVQGVPGFRTVEGPEGVILQGAA